MRILHLDSGREMRGGQWQALRLHHRLLKAGHESHLLAREGSPLAQEAETLHPLRLAHLSRQFDIVHAHDAHSHTLCALFARVPFVVSRRVAFPVKNTAASRWKYGRPALFLAVSNFVAQRLRDAGVQESRIAVVYDGVPVPVSPAQGDAVLVPYTLDPAKGMALAEQAAQLAGVQLQHSTNLAADLPRAKALVYISQSEGLGSGVLLAMAHGVTVVASNTGGIPELIEDGVTGILVPNDAQAIANSLRHLNRHLGASARLVAMDRFTEEHMLNSTLDAYTRVLHHG